MEAAAQRADQAAKEANQAAELAKRAATRVQQAPSREARYWAIACAGLGALACMAGGGALALQLF
jgi:hypothetical protein